MKMSALVRCQKNVCIVISNGQYVHKKCMGDWIRRGLDEEAKPNKLSWHMVKGQERAVSESGILITEVLNTKSHSTSEEENIQKMKTDQNKGSVCV